MNRDLYRKISRPFRKNKQTVKFVRLLNLALTGLVYVAYPALMLYVLAIYMFRKGLAAM